MYFGKRMYAPDFNLMNFIAAEGCSEKMGDEKVLQFVRFALHPNHGRRRNTVGALIEKYNRLDGRTDKVEPVVFYPSLHDLPIVCFKSRAPTDNNPILKRIAQAKLANDPEYWKWTLSGKESSGLQQDGGGGTVSKRQQKITSIHDILRGIKLPESVVSVQRVYDELSEPYYRKYGKPLGEGTGCIPLEHRDFAISEIKRLFEEELSYIEQPSVQHGALPLHAKALVDNAGWMGDIILTGDAMMDSVPGGSIIRSVRVENSVARKSYVRTEKTGSDSMERRGVGFVLREFLIFYALKWNDAVVDSVSLSVDALHAGWKDALETPNVLRSLMAGAGLTSYLSVEGFTVKVSSVKKLVKLLCDEGFIVQTIAATPATPLVKRMEVSEDSVPVASIVKFFRGMLATEWNNDTIETAEVTAADVVRALNGGSVGAYRKSCVSQFMRPFLFDGSVEGYSWREGALHLEKYVVHVKRVAGRVNSMP